MSRFTPIEESYRFSCTMCANCCTGDQRVMLTLYDLHKMGRFLHFTNSRKLFDEGWVKLVKRENEVWRPQIRFKTKPFKFCPFLNNEMNEEGKMTGRCQLHPKHKPLVCAMAPVGRIVDMDYKADEFVFVKPAPDCPGVRSSKENPLKQLLDTYRRELEYQWSFFELLDKAKELKLNKQDSLDMIYTFPIGEDFVGSINAIFKKL